MQNPQDRTQSPMPLDDLLAWHRPTMQRLEISTDTRFGGVSTDDGDGFGLVTDLQV
jgi:hypothetical protein